MTDFLIYYAAFALSGGVVCTWKLCYPSLNYIQETFPKSKINDWRTLSALVFFIWATVMAPFMIPCLYYEEQFCQAFINNLLKIDNKK